MKEKDLIELLRQKLLPDWKSGQQPGNMWLEFENYKILFTTSTFKSAIRISEDIRGLKIFPEVENILDPYYRKHNLPGLIYTIHTSSLDEKLFDIRLKSPEDVEKLLVYLKPMIDNDILPFFNTYKLIKQVHERLQNLPEEEQSSFINNPVAIRGMIIKALLRTDDFGKYAQDTMEFYREHSQGPYKNHFAPYYQFLPELYKQLQNMIKN